MKYLGRTITEHSLTGVMNRREYAESWDEVYSFSEFRIKQCPTKCFSTLADARAYVRKLDKKRRK